MTILYPGATARDIERFIALQAQAENKAAVWAAVRDYRDFYSGNHPVMLSERQQEFLGDILTETDHVVAFNLCRVVVDVLRERLKVEGFTGKDPAGEELASLVWDWWQTAKMDAEQIKLHRRALRDGAGYLIIDWDDSKKQPVWKCNRAYDGDVGVTYHVDAETGDAIMGIKYWRVSDIMSTRYNQLRRTVYLPDRILRHKADGNAVYGWSPIDEDEGKAEQWWTDNWRENGKPLGLACIQFENPEGQSDIMPVIGLQNALNKTVLDLLAAADVTGFQMLAISYSGPLASAPTDDDDETTDDLKIAPGRAIELGDGAQVSAIPPGDLGQLINAINTLVGFISGATRTPHYYLRPFGGADVPSGEALKQLETALVARAEERFVVFGDSWVEAMRVGARLYRAMGNSGADPEAQIETNWGDPNIRNDMYATQVATAEKALGIPEEVLWERRLGYSPDDVKLFKQSKANADAANLANILMAVGNGNSGAGGTGNGGPAGSQNGGALGIGAGRQQPEREGGRERAEALREEGAS